MIEIPLEACFNFDQDVENTIVSTKSMMERDANLFFLE